MYKPLVYKNKTAVFDLKTHGFRIRKRRFLLEKQRFLKRKTAVFEFIYHIYHLSIYLSHHLSLPNYFIDKHLTAIVIDVIEELTKKHRGGV